MVGARVDHGARGAGGSGGTDEFIGIETRAAQREEQLAGSERARVTRYAGVRAIGSDELAAAGARQIRERAIHAVPRGDPGVTRCASALLTTFWSLNARRSRP